MIFTNRKIYNFLTEQKLTGSKDTCQLFRTFLYSFINYLDFTKILPLAAGVWAFPTNSTSAMMVTTYGIMEIRFGDTTLLWAARERIPLQSQNSRHALVAPSGENLPKITAAMAMKPCPTITLGRNWLMVARVTKAPPRPARKPDRITQV